MHQVDLLSTFLCSTRDDKLCSIVNGQARHQHKIQKVFLRLFPLSRFLVKTLRVNKIAMKSFSRYLSTLNGTYSLSYIKLTHIT